MTEKIDPGAGYRLLNNGETIETGDEFYRPPGNWRASDLLGRVVGDSSQGTHGTYRRKIAPLLLWQHQIIPNAIKSRLPAMDTSDRWFAAGAIAGVTITEAIDLIGWWVKS